MRDDHVSSDTRPLRRTIAAMRIEVRDDQGVRLGDLQVADGLSPPRGRTDQDIEVFPDWERARDDQGHLRRCVICGSDHLYRQRRLPRMTGFIVVLALAMAAAAILDLASGWPMLVAMVALLIFDVAVLVLSDEMLTCYRCRSGYRRLAIARYHRPWNRRTAAKCRRT